ncbi:hypothetical protein GCM10025794_37760 [Massilia kyonggiensis]
MEVSYTEGEMRWRGQGRGVGKENVGGQEEMSQGKTESINTKLP